MVRLRTVTAVLSVVVLATLAGCLGRSLPIPPPGISATAVTDCPVSECPLGGVIVAITGTAPAGAQVIVEDTNPAARSADGDVVGGVARATPSGTWRVLIEPVRDPATGAVLAVQRGDSLNVYSVTGPPDNGTSNSVYVSVPRR